MNRFGQWALRATGPALLAFLLLRVVDYGELRDVFGGMRPGWALGALAAMQLIMLLRAVRWLDIHEAFGLPPASPGYHLRLSYATGLATVALPQILSPFSRFVLMLQDGYRAKPVAAGSALEKVLELGAYVGFGVFGSFFLAATFGGLVWWAIGLAVVAFVSSFGLYRARSQLGRLASALLERVAGLVGGGASDAGEVAQGIVSLDARVLVRLSGWSFAIALTQATMLYLLSRSLGLDLSYGFMVAVWGIIALSMLLPISVNGVGTREAILAVAFEGADRSSDAAVALGLLVLAVVAVGSSPGAIEWLLRAFGGSATPSGAGAAYAVSERTQASVRPQGERRA